MTPNAHDLRSMLCFDLYAANLAFGRLYQKLLDPLGLTYPQYLALAALWCVDDMTMGELGERLGLDSGTLTPMIKRLEALGFASRRRDPADERRVRVAATASGRALRDRAEAVPGCVAAATGLEPEQIVQLQSVLRRLKASLAAAAPGPTVAA
jgi:DNA-binding MarR family transcriptional regulator